MLYQEAKDARAMSGVRLAMNKGQPGLWGQAARQMLEYKAIPYIAVAQYPAAANEDLVAWTGCRNAPVLVADDRPPVSSWREIIDVVEQIKPEPAVLPQDSGKRNEALRIVELLAGQDGYAWSGRVMIFDQMKKRSATQAGSEPAGIALMHAQYGYSEGAAARAAGRCDSILTELASVLKSQRSHGSAFFVGSTLTAADIYWACFSNALEPWPPWALSETLRSFWRTRPPRPHTDDENLLLEQRDQMLRDYLSPIDF